MSEAIVEVRGLYKDFIDSGPWPWSPSRSFAAVRNVSFKVQPGEVIGLVGQSGSGKTTVARIVLGLEAASRGSVWLEGRRWDNLSEAERRPMRAGYQYVPQDAMAALDPQQTALEHVIETNRVLGGYDRHQARERAESLLVTLGLGARLEALPREMSGGEQRRVTLARVLALSPKLVVADEPTSGLDPERREEVLQALVGNLPEDAACIIVTHDMAEAKTWCDRILVMLHGEVVEEISGADGVPQHPYSKVLFDPWAGPIPDFTRAATQQIISGSGSICHDGEGSKQ